MNSYDVVLQNTKTRKYISGESKAVKISTAIDKFLRRNDVKNFMATHDPNYLAAEIITHR